MTGDVLRPPALSTSQESPRTAKTSALVECLHVHKTYGSGPTVFRDMNVQIGRGDFVFLTGPGGAGKTTFLKLLLGMERPDSGMVLIEGRNVHSLRERDMARFRQRIGMVFQDLKLVPNRTVYENVALPLFALSKGVAVTRQRVTQTLSALRLQEKMAVVCERLSESERQRTAIARAVVHNPVLLLADEPTAHLDEEDTAIVVELLKKAGMAGATVVVTAHGTSQAAVGASAHMLEICDRRLVEHRRGGSLQHPPEAL
jgi:cell division transport system ATP-binding protein